MNAIKENKRVVRDFLERHYTDEKLAALLAHMRDGKFSYYSCCCLVGIPTADHALQGDTHASSAAHYLKAKDDLVGADLAEVSLRTLGTSPFGTVPRSRIYMYLLPMVRAEIKRREAVRQKEQSNEKITGPTYSVLA